MANWLNGWTALETIDLSLLDTQNVTNMQYLFFNCNEAATINLSGWNTSNVTNMGYMFQYCKMVLELDLSSFNTSKVTTTFGTFADCTSLVILDLTSFDMSALTNIQWMFARCTSLTTIYVTDGNWTLSKLTAGGSTFTGSTKLVGGAGTTYSSDWHTYACVDKEGQPGYFSVKTAVETGSAIPQIETQGVQELAELEATILLDAEESQLTPSENLAKEDVASSGEAASAKKDLETGAVSAEKSGEAGESTANAAASTGELATDAVVPAKEELAEVASEPTQLADEPVVAAAGDYQDQAIAAGEVVAGESSEGSSNTALLGRSLEAGEGEVSGASSLSFEEVAAAVAVVPAGMLLAAFRRRAA
jgi:surface protein